MKAYVFILAAFLTGFSAKAQLTESFSDHDFTANPLWFGSSSSWTVVSNSDAGAGAAGSNTLRLSSSSGDVTDYLSTQITGGWGQEQSWSFWIGRRAQAATASNVAFVWLYANEAKADNSSVDGYRLRFGDDLPGGDRIVLESVVDGSASPFINSTGSIPNGLTDYGFMVRITRTPAGLWTLYTSPLPTVSGTGAIATDSPSPANTFVMQGTGTNTVITQFDDGFISLASNHTASSAARAGVEFDQISFSAASNGALPVRWGDFSLRQTRQGVLLSWTNLSESDVLYYQPQRSADGQNFISLSTVYPTVNNGSAASYNYLDAPAPLGMVFYRIAARDNGGQTNYTRILRTGSLPANASNTGTGDNGAGGDGTNREEAMNRFNAVAVADLKLYPNPVIGYDFQVCGSDYPKGVYNLLVYNNDGRKLYEIKLVHEGGVFRASVRLGSISQVPMLKAPPGLYHLIIRGPVIAQKDFVVQ